MSPTEEPTKHAKLSLAPLAANSDEPIPIITPALSVALRFIAAVISALGLVVTGYFWFKSENGALFFAFIVMTPVLALYRRNTTFLLALAALCIVSGFTSCAANFHWAGG